MEQHFKINCKYQVKECEFKDVGCKFTVSSVTFNGINLRPYAYLGRL